MKRESGNFVKKALACTKKALKKMMKYLYSTGVTASDYQNAVLLCLLWYRFGRASDLSLLCKVNLSIGSGGIIFLRLIRVKTSEEQGLCLFPDDDFTTCPLLAIVVALKPVKNGIISAKEFKTLCITVAKACKIRVNDEATRHLRLTMNATVASTSPLSEAIEVVFMSLAERQKRRATLDDIREWLAPLAVDNDEGGGDEDTYYLVEWDAMGEPHEHLSRTIVASFEKERRLLVRKKFFEDEAVEDNSLNIMEG
ncbi:Hypothetical protein PHPALM_19978 [Phytophthora palmivora]|uniref:Uncharacterized protein n=1 Tax=Phytophthora palmivora TaxID=4796 RepID=A0A2P4XG07_9STRA|nr:Hypothetical protein PHPALM_19978 [Phytophthora palmivora]